MKITHLAVITAVMLTCGQIVHADEVPEPFILGEGSISLTNSVGGHDRFTICGTQSSGFTFMVDTYKFPGYVEIKISNPSIMWEGDFIFRNSDKGRDFHTGSAYWPGVEPLPGIRSPTFFLYSSTGGTPSDYGLFYMTSFHRRPDGIVDRVSFDFEQQGKVDPLGDIIIQSGTICFSVVPEPSMLAMFGLSAVIGIIMRRK